MALEDQVDNLEKKLDMVLNLLQEFRYTFPTKKSVATFFGVSERTIDYWIKNGKFEEGIEYTTDNNGKIKYITDGILSHQKKSPSNHKQDSNSNKTKTIGPATDKILKSLSCLR
ncbi:helix-turn-helix domain containing protein [Aliarcobacter butzleri]|uniref:helix-turn-helix domain containing protein n=1 Tax=Aliarcobacter butzleri TaxID=28197 RepID=UPI001EDA6F05|nr:helix-turn-helix domain containing protein [Aliarcobacter butzleri]MCG3711491.1 helix-turn-helix domain containing protein [Aliarcobacter butzleri]MCG3713942.1 helix-turn-helix domain containing protein [Aliarcobacter butzleri]